MHLLKPYRKAGCLKLCLAERNERRRRRGFGRVCRASVADSFVPFRFFRLPARVGMASQAVQRTNSSGYAEWRCGGPEWLAPVADLSR
jgi:hypothetical protein